MKRRYRIAISLATLGAIVWYMGGLADLKGVLLGANMRYLLLALVIATVDRALMSYKWGMLLRDRGIRFPFFKNLVIYCTSMVWGMFLPSTVGADAIRAYSASRVVSHGDDIIASIAVERMIGFLVSLVVGLMGLAILSTSGHIDERFDPVWIAAAITLTVGGLAFALSFSRTLFSKIYDNFLVRLRDYKIVAKLRKLHSAYISYGGNYITFAKFGALTVSEQLLTIVFDWVIALSMNVGIGLLLMAGTIPLTMLVARLPISVDGIGVFEGVFVLLMSLVGVPAADALSIALMGRIIQTAAWMPWWAISLLRPSTIAPSLAE